MESQTDPNPVHDKAPREVVGRKPIGLEWRSSYWFTTLVVGSGIAIDLLVYSIIIPVIPFQLESLGYTGVSALAGWLLFAYSGGLLLSTLPVAMLSEAYNARRWPLLIGFAILIGSQIMFMEAPNYAVMCVARVLQGIGSSVVWVVGLALLCDSTPEALVGQQLGIAMIGFSIGLVLGPPIGGALYSRFGFRGPFIFGIIFAFVDLLGRLVIIERKDALKWGHDPHNPSGLPAEVREIATSAPSGQEKSDERADSGPTNGETDVNVEDGQPAPKKTLSQIAVLVKLAKSPRALAAALVSLVYGAVVSSQEPSIPVHLQAVWDLSPERVGVVFIAAVVPTLFSTPLSGYLSDKRGTEWTAALCLLLSIPWFVVMILESHLALFIVAFGLATFFASGSISPVTAELAAVARSIEGVGYGHVYGVFNLAYGAGSTIGPVIGGQMYDHLKHGWQAVTLFGAGIVSAALLVSICFIGERPLAQRLFNRSRPDTQDQEP